MENVLFPDLDPVSRIRRLEDNASEILADHHYERSLSEDEVAEYREVVCDAQIEIGRITDEMKEVVDGFKERLKKQNTVAAGALRKVRTRRMEAVETLYEIPDYEEGKIGTYNGRGILISERPMKVSERQRRLDLGGAGYSVKVS